MSLFKPQGINPIYFSMTKSLFKRTKLTAKEITESYEYKQFKKDYPELCKLVEK